MPSAITTAKKWVDAFNKKKLPSLMALYAANARNAQSHLPQPIKGKAAIEKDLGGFLAAFPDARMKVLSLVAKGDTVAMEWSFTGTHKGPLESPMGAIPPTGKKLTLKGGEFLKLNAKGLIIDERGYFNVNSFMMQLGLAGPPPSQH